MAKQRLQTQRGINPVLPRPMASPTDTFVRTNGGAQGEQLARALGSIAPGLNRLGMTLFQRSAEDDRVKGEALARKLHESGNSLAKAVRDGKVPANESPWFMEGLQEQFGRTSADKWQSDLMGALATDEGMQQATSMDAFDAYVAQHRSKWLAENVGDEGRDARFELGFGGRSDAYYADERRKFAAQLDNRVKGMGDEAHFMEVKAAALRAAEEGTDPAALGGAITNLNSALLKQGRNGTSVNLNTVRAVTAAALEVGGEKGRALLSTLGNVKAGSGLLKDTQYGSEALLKANDELDARFLQQEARRTAQAKVVREEASRTVTTEALGLLQADPHADLSGLLQKAQAMRAPELVSDLQQIQRSVQDLSWRTDDDVQADLTKRILSPAEGDEPVTASTITQALIGKQLRNEDAVAMFRLLNERESASGQRINGDPNYQMALRNIRSLFGSELSLSGEAATRAGRAQNALAHAWFDLERNGKLPGMDTGERIKWLSSMSDLIFKQQSAGLQLQVNPAPPPSFPTVGPLGQSTQGAPSMLARPASGADSTGVPLSLLPPQMLQDFGRSLRVTNELSTWLTKNNIPPAAYTDFLLQQLEADAAARKEAELKASQAKLNEE